MKKPTTTAGKPFYNGKIQEETYHYSRETVFIMVRFKKKRTTIEGSRIYNGKISRKTWRTYDYYHNRE
ncbi:hypothetical protein BSG1_08536 [Bacillus sp. SG-1]|nr:hypothetical protein BSG1_08536 [Bacillus sp. SG-1]